MSVEKAIILRTSWDDDSLTGADVLVVVEMADKSIVLHCMDDPDKRVIITFEELEAISKLVEEAKREWGDPKPEAPDDNQT